MTRTWWAAAALLAIFAMHGLATHASAAGPAALPAPAAEADAASHMAHAAPSPRPTHSASPGDEVLAGASTWASTRHADGHGAMQVIGLCLAVLATAAIALLGLARSEPGLVALLPRATGPRTPPTAASRHHGPPDLHSLSILRC